MCVNIAIFITWLSWNILRKQVDIASSTLTEDIKLTIVMRVMTDLLVGLKRVNVRSFADKCPKHELPPDLRY